MKPNSSPAFDGAYLERYRRGELSSSEAHALEKAALEDPLLADALDGFRMATRDTSADLALLRSQLEERIEANQAAIRQLPKTRFFSPLLRIAAILFILIGAGWFSYVFWVGPRESALANNTAAPPSAAEPRIIAESIPGQGPIPPTAPPPTPAKEPKLAQNVSDQIIRPAQAPLETREIADKPQETMMAQVEQPQATPEAKQLEAVSKDDSVKDQAVVYTESVVKESELASNRQALAAAQVAKEKSLSQSKLKKQRTDNPEPVDGWAAYEEYLYGNRSRLDAAPTASNTVTRWQVLLSFEVDKKGRPADIRVDESGGIYYDDAAKKLLREGPDWKPGKPGSRAQLRVLF